MQVPNLLVHNYWGDLSVVREVNPQMLHFLSSDDSGDAIEIGAVYSMWDGSVSALKRDTGNQTTVVCIPNPKKIFLDLEFLKALAERGRVIILYRDYVYDPCTKKWTNSPEAMPPFN